MDLGYRLWLLRTLARGLIPALSTIYLFLRILDTTPCPPGRAVRILSFVFGLPVLFILKRKLTQRYHEMKARRLGMSLPPLVEGRWFGNVDAALRFFKGMSEDYVGDVIDEFLDQVGADTARISFLWTKDKLITRDPDVVRYMATTGFQDFGKGDETRVRAGTLFNKSIFVTDGSMWKTHRMLARPYFSRDRVSDYVTFAKYADKMVNIMTHFARRGEAVDVQDLFGRFTFDTAGEFLIGADDLNTLDDPLPRAGCAKLGPMGTAIEGQHGRFATAFKDAQVELVTRAFTPLIYWTAAEFFGDRQVEPIREIDAYLLPMVKEALRKKREVRITDGEETFLEHLVGSTDDVEIIRHQLLGMLVAARDTTACLLTFACYLLSQHPEVFNTLREEVLSTVGSTEHPDHQQIKQMKYLRAVLNETLRLFPPVPVDARTSCKEAIIPSPQSRGGGVYVPKSGTEIWFSLMSIHKRKDIWGDDANEFDPGRWLGPSQEGEIAEGDPVEFMPFFAGPRVCIGQQLAYNEASFVMVRLAQAFRKFTLVQVDAAPVGSLPPESWKDAKGKRKAVEKIVPLSAVTMFAKGGTWLQMNLA